VESVYREATREFSSLSKHSKSSEVSNLQVKEPQTGSTNFVINKVKNLHVYQN